MMERYTGGNKVELQEDEKRLIEDKIGHLDTIVISIFDNLDELDRVERQVAIYNADTCTPTGIHLGYSIYGEPEIQTDPKLNEFEQFYKLVFGDEFVKIYLNRDYSIQQIQTNITTDKPYAVARWLDKAYETFDYILNSPENFYSEWEHFSEKLPPSL